MQQKKRKKVEARVLGKSGGQALVISHRGRTLVDLPVETAYAAWKNAIPARFKKT